mgnify:CR=1 FL=1
MLPTSRGQGMSSILTFRPRKKSTAAKPKQDPTPAKVIIFPGVRYERTHATDGAARWAPAAWLALQSRPLPTV